MAWRLINGKYVEVDEQGNPIADGKSYYRSGATKFTGFQEDPRNDVIGTDGFKHNNLFRSGKGSDFDKMVERFLTTGEVMSAKQLGIKQEAWDNINSDLDKFLEYNNIDRAAYSNDPALVEGNQVQDLGGVEGLFGFDTPGSVGNTLFDIYRQANQDQYDSSMKESAYMEKDLNKMIGQERQSLIDSMREDRKKMLKSGLSQSAIANREIQGLLQGQNIATELGTGFLTERRNLNQMGGTIDSMAKTQAVDAINAGVGNAYGGIKAAGAGDLWEQALAYSRGGHKAKGTYDWMLDEQRKK